MNSTSEPIDAAEPAAFKMSSTPSKPDAPPNPTVRLELRDEPRATSAVQTRNPWVKHVVVAAVIAAATTALGALAHHWWTVGRFIQSTDDAYVGGDVTVIAPKVAGFISQVAVTDNQAVHAGDLLLKLDDRDYRAALAKAEADVAWQEATLTNLDAARDLQDAMVAQAQAGMAAADAEIVRTQDDQARAQNLLARGVDSTQEFQKADADYKTALANGDKARAALEAARRQVSVIATQKQQVRAAREAAIAQRDLARLNLSYTELHAPIDGVVGNRSAQLGAYATVGSQLLSLVPSHGLWIDANFKEDQLARMRPGAPASVQVDLLGGRTFRGHVASLAPATGAQFSVLPPENATGNFTKIVQRVAVRILLEDEPAALALLRPGLSVTAWVNTK